MVTGSLNGGKYRLARQIGEEAIGIVLAAVNELTSREVAIKLMLKSTPDLRHRLLREAKPFFVMPLLHAPEQQRRQS